MNVLNVVLSGIVTCFTAIVSIENLSDIKINKKNIIIFVLLYLALMYLNVFNFDGISRVIINVCIMILVCYFSFFEKNLSNSVYYSLAYELIAFLSEIFISIMVLIILKFDSSTYANFPCSMLLSSILNSVFVYIITKIKYVNISIRRLNKYINSNNKDWLYIIILFVLMILVITFNRYNLESTLQYFINMGVVIFIILSFVYVIYSKIQKSAYENKYNEVMEYVTRYEKIINEQGKKNHEYNNQLMVLKGYLDKPDRLKDYLELIIGEHKTGQNYTVKQLGFLPDGGIKGLLYHKLSKMEEEGIKPYLYVDQSMQELSEDIFDIKTCQDITKILGVFIDNAIDASSKAEQKEIEIDFKVQKDCLIISVANTYDNKTDVNKIGKKGYSTKGAGHEFGLSIVKDISKNNPNIESFSDISDNKFKQTVLIYYKK